MSDESTTPTDGTPFSVFETGAIDWTQSTGGEVMYGDVFKGYQKNNNSLGLPISNLATIWIGSGIYCERGIVWTCPALKGAVFVGSLQPPLMGQPVIAPAGASNTSGQPDPMEHARE